MKEKWLDARKSELLPCPYFHNVFTLPHELNPLILNNKKVMLAMLFTAAKENSPGLRSDDQHIERQAMDHLLKTAARSLSTFAIWGGPEHVLEYLGHYTHRVAITNNRIVSIEGGEVSFNYRDRSDENKVKVLTLKATEFIRRYLLHILPRGFMKIRYYGFLGHANKKVSIPLLRLLIDPEAKIAVKIGRKLYRR